IREVRKNKHAGWFTFVTADGEGHLVNIEGSPERIVVEPAEGRLVRVLYGSREMTGTRSSESVAYHARCRKMYDLLDNAQGKTALARLRASFAAPKSAITVGKAPIAMVVFDTPPRKAFLSRGPSYEVAWRTFLFAARP